MKKPVLVVMAAGMGSRYGGLKQIDPVDKEGHIIMDFSIYDAVRAGFKKVCFPGSEQSSGRIQRSGRTCKTLGNRSCDFKLPGRGRRTICCY